VLMDRISGGVGTLEVLSVVTDDQRFVNNNNPTSEPLVVSSSAAGSLSPKDIARGQETETTGEQSTSPLHDQTFVIYTYCNTQ